MLWRTKGFGDVGQILIGNGSMIRREAVRTARWDVSPFCNLSCLHCCAEDLYSQIDSAYLDAEAVVNVLHILSQQGVRHLNILGKEPFLHPDIFAILENACSSGFNVDVTTNGTAIAEKDIARLVDLGLRSIYFSIDGASREVNDRIRGDGVFERVVRTMDRFINEKTRKDVRVMVNVNTVLTRLNQHRILDLLPFCWSHGVDLFRLSHLMVIGNAARNVDLLQLEAQDEFRVGETVASVMSDYPGLRSYILTDRPLFLEYLYERHGAELPVRLSGCKACMTEIYIDPVGRISPCLATSPGFSEASNGPYSHYDVSIFDLQSESTPSSPFAGSFILDYPFSGETYENYVPCASCPYLGTVCYPCPLDSSIGTHVEELCVIARAELERLRTARVS